MESSGELEPRPGTRGGRLLVPQQGWHPASPEGAGGLGCAPAYLVEGRHGCGTHHQGDADDGVAVEAVCVGHHHDARDGEDGGHDLDGRRREGGQGGGGDADGQRGSSVHERSVTRGSASLSVLFGE